MSQCTVYYFPCSEHTWFTCAEREEANMSIMMALANTRAVRGGIQMILKKDLYDGSSSASLLPSSKIQ